MFVEATVMLEIMRTDHFALARKEDEIAANTVISAKSLDGSTAG